jgi:hypothetical protein
MNAAAQELARHGAAIRSARQREKVHAGARQLCLEMGRPIPPALLPELLLVERVGR